MALTPYDTNILRALKWQQGNAPNVTSLITQKADWYQKNHTDFWTNWEASVFDLRTAGPFGILIWCIILGVPSQLFGLYGNSRGWAYGPNRQNYKYVGDASKAPANANLIGGNFAGGGSTSILSLKEARWALRLRYAALVSNGRIEFVNYMLNWIFNDGKAWDFANKKYFYVADSTIVPVAASPGVVPVAAINGAFKIEYRIGAAMDFSAQFINLLNSPQFGITPQFAGSQYTVIVED